MVVRAATFATVILALAWSDLSAAAQGRREHAPGQFDFYVLALSWSPSFCAAAEERAPGRVPAEQCDGRPYSFVIHGLWPQYEKGFPQYCRIPAPRLDGALVSSMLDLMPSSLLIQHEWERHGTCAGLEPRAYFDQVRRVREAIEVPPEYRAQAALREVAPAEIEEAFIAVNPGLAPSAISVTCDDKRVSEVRICFSKDIRFRDCAELERRSCRRSKLLMPAVRGGATPAKAR